MGKLDSPIKHLNLRFGSLASLSKIDSQTSKDGRWCPPVPYFQLEKENLDLQTRLAKLASKNEQLKIELEVAKAKSRNFNEIGVGSSKLVLDDSSDNFDSENFSLGEYSERLI